jgi:hypothetical protein
MKYTLKDLALGEYLKDENGIVMFDWETTARMYQLSQAYPARYVIETMPKNELLDAAYEATNAFRIGDVKTFNDECKKLAAMTGRPVYESGWEMRWTIKNLLDGIVRRETSTSHTGNSGSR